MFKNVPVLHETDFHGQKLSLQTGLLAQQATASVIASLGETTVMANVVIGKVMDADYFPLQVIYEEKMYASGKIKGSRFIKREGRPSDSAILTGRMIDRSLRSLFDDKIRNEIQVIVTVLSLDEVNPPDTLAVLASSSALKIASDQFLGPVSSVRVGLKRKPIGEVFASEVLELSEKTQNFEEFKPFLEKVSEVLDTKREEDKIFIREIAKTLAKINPDWAKNFSEIYRSIPKLSYFKAVEKYPTEIETLVNPSYATQENSLVDLVVSGDGKNIMMVEAGTQIITEEIIGKCLDKANSELLVLNNFQKEFIQKARDTLKKNVFDLTVSQSDEVFVHYWETFLADLEYALFFPGTKEEKATKFNEFTNPHWTNIQLISDLIKKPEFADLENLRIYLVKNATDSVHGEFSEINGQKGLNLEISQNLINLLEKGFNPNQIKQELQKSLDYAIKGMVQQKILEEEKRIDGRKLDEVRPLLIQIDVLPRVHGSSLFQRGETQVLNVLTLGTLRDAQTLDEMEDFEETTKRYIHHYNFPSYSVGETGRYGAPGRREIGHGALAEKALVPVLPSEEDFPYTMRLVSECLGSNGSSSMASTCASTLSLLAGGVPIKDLVAGVAMGLVVDSASGNFKVLTDIQGPEDHYGDMDFKVTGTADGVTAIQLDNKVAGLTVEILKQALIEAKKGRLFILEKMKHVINSPKENISQYAPGVMVLDIPVDKIGEVIGPSGKNIKAIIAKFDVEIDITDDSGKTYIYSNDKEKCQQAHDFIKNMIREYKPGETVEGRIFRIENYGAFVKILSNGQETGKEGMIHISNMANKRVEKVEDVVKMDQIVTAKITEINDKGQIALSMKT